MTATLLLYSITLHLKTRERNKTSLKKPEMAKLLLEMGLTVSDGEMNALIDAFDSNGDGSISRNEFIDFIGKGI